MLIIGAKGFAKEVLEIVKQMNDVRDVVFYDDRNIYENNLLFNKFKVLTSEIAAKNYFNSKDSRFTIGIGNPILRKKMYDKFLLLDGKLSSTVSLNASLGNYEVIIGEGNNIMSGAIVSNNVKTGKGCIIYYNAVITHDVELGDFVEISPAAVLLGRCKIGNYSQIGANATILPDVIIGKNAIVAAGAVVTKDVPDNTIVAGVPAEIKKNMQPFKF